MVLKIFITGIAGFIGSHTGERLINEGHHVIGIDNFDPFYPKSFKEFNLENLQKSDLFTFYNADIRDQNALKKIFETHQIDLVIHLAAKAGVRPSIDNIEDYYDVNINGSLALLEVMKSSGVKKIVFASSSSVYGNNSKIPFAEADVVDHPISPYAATKKSGELLCHVYSHLYGFDITCLRFFTVFGPKQRPDLAIHKFTHLIDSGKEIPFYGDGSTARDYTYVDDIVDGVILASKNLSGYKVYNLGESRVITLKELIQSIEKHTGKKALINELPLQPGDVEKTYADIAKAKTEINYDPRFSFDEGIKRFVEWYNLNKKRLYN